jgi:hypothetical protein
MRRAVRRVQVTYTVVGNLEGPANVRLRVEAKSSRKGVEYVEVAVDGPLLTAGLPAGHTPGSVRIAAGLKSVQSSCCMLGAARASRGCEQHMSTACRGPWSFAPRLLLAGVRWFPRRACLTVELALAPCLRACLLVSWQA